MTVTSEATGSDAVLLAALRRTWETVDPVPAEFVDAMVAAVASDDLGREYALLTLLDSDATSPVRGDADMLTLQFGDGKTNLLVHVTPAERDLHRLDGWVDGDVADVVLLAEGEERSADVDGGRFSIDAVPSGALPSPGRPVRGTRAGRAGRAADPEIRDLTRRAAPRHPTSLT